MIRLFLISLMVIAKFLYSMTSPFMGKDPFILNTKPLKVS